MSTTLSVIRDAALATILAAGIALGYNAVRAEGSIVLVADKPYQILVPCPEHRGKPAKPLAPGQVRPGEAGTALIDAREREAYDRWHAAGAISIPFDYLEPNPEEQKVLQTRARKVVVYGDGEDPDSGQQLANAIAGKGVRNVFFVKGGAPALKKKAGK